MKSNDILRSWKANAENWISVIDKNEIESRTLVTNAAIFEIIVKYNPKKVIDIGCGEGWLTRRLIASGIATHGIDAIESLIKNAVEKGGNNYSVCSYENFISGRWSLIDQFDAAAINFALLDKTITEKLLQYLSQSLMKESLIFIQTLHPFSIALTETYESGWKDGSWNGLKKDFTDPYQWYFRTLEDWIKLFNSSGLILKELKEPIHPQTKKPVSVIFVLKVL